MNLKPPRWNVSPALIAPEAQSLWKGVAFVFPGFAGAHLGGGGLLLGPAGTPLPGITLTAGATAEARVTPYGPGVGISGSSNLLQRDNFEPVVTSDGAGTGDFTLLVLANPISEARRSYVFSQEDSSDTGARFTFNGLNQTNQAGTVSFRTRSGGVGAIVTLTGVIDGNYHSFVSKREGTEHAIYLDGLIKATATSTARGITSGALGFGLGQQAESSNNRIDTACNIVLAGAWNRALSDAEIRLLARDPFCMFRMAEHPTIYYLPSGAYLLSADPGAMAIVGASASPLAGRALSGDVGGYSITGVSASPLAGRAIGASPGALNITGANTSAIADRTIIASPGSLTITGLAASVLAGRMLSADPGAIVITGLAASLIGTSVGAHVLNADPGSMAITGAASGIIADRIIAALSGSIAVTGGAAGLAADRLLTASPGAYSVTGASASAIAARMMAADPGAYVITGLSVGFGVPALATYGVEIVILSDAREIIILGDPREIVVN